MAIWPGNIRRTADRFWSKVDKETGPVHPTLGRCWIWTAARSPRGYGVFGNWTRALPGPCGVRAHRVSYLLDRGSLPPAGAQIMHLCHVSSCVRPDHLKAGTAKQNAEDSVEAGHFQRGDGHYAAKLTEADVIAIRERRAGGASTVDLAREYGVTVGSVSALTTGRKWAHFGGPRTPRGSVRVRRTEKPKCRICREAGHNSRCCPTGGQAVSQ
jgi:hypothetical protein